MGVQPALTEAARELIIPRRRRENGRGGVSMAKDGKLAIEILYCHD